MVVAGAAANVANRPETNEDAASQPTPKPKKVKRSYGKRPRKMAAAAVAAATAAAAAAAVRGAAAAAAASNTIGEEGETTDVCGSVAPAALATEWTLAAVAMVTDRLEVLYTAATDADRQSRARGGQPIASMDVLWVGPVNR
jgi:outer membrane protein W